VQIETLGLEDSLPKNIHFIYMLKVDGVDGIECMVDDGLTHHHGESKSKVAQKTMQA
jgi:hypothetical protein